MKLSLIALVLTVIAADAAVAAVNPFVGTWKTNPDKSKLTGRTITYTKTAKGYHFAGGGGS